MRKFTDNAGRSWDLTVDINAARRVRDLLGVDLLQPAAGDPPLLVRLTSDLILLVDVLFVVCRADAAGVGGEAFAAAMDGKGLAAAQAALMEDLADFFRRLGRRDAVAMIDGLQKIVTEAVAQATERIEATDVAGLVRAALGPSSGDSPAPPGSTPGP